jgi:hypothetical protein
MYYRVVINMRQVTEISYAKKPPAPEDFTRNVLENHTMWTEEGVKEFRIGKIYLPDGNPGAEYLIEPTTYGIARVLFDEKGLYVYVDVTDSNVSTTAATSNHHLRDSVEIFVNEDFKGHTSGGYGSVGGQYRIGANNEVSGDPGDAPAALTSLGKRVVWKKEDNTGYVVMALVPWRFKNTYPLTIDEYGVVGKTIGLELQINEAVGNAERRCTMVWNNIATSNYQNIANFAEVKLDLAGNELKKDAQQPNFLEHPASGWYYKDEVDSVLSVNATVGEGTITYEWYQASSWTSTGTKVAGATYSTLDLNTLDLPVGIYYFYAKAINSNPQAEGDIKVNSANSIPARIQVFAAGAEVVEQLTLKNSYAIYEFNVPSTGRWDNYAGVTVDYRVDAANLAKTVKSFSLMGNYNWESDFDGNDNLLRDFAQSENRRVVAPWDDTPDVIMNDFNRRFIYDDVVVRTNGTTAGGVAFKDAVADVWFKRIYHLGNSVTGWANSPNAAFTTYGNSKPDSGDNGKFLFGIGIPGDSAPITQLVRNVTLVHKSNVNNDGTLKTTGYDKDLDIVSHSTGLPGTAFTGYTGSDLAPSDRLFRTEVVVPADRTFTFNVKNTALIPDQYQLIHTLDLGDDFDVTPYTQISAVMRFYNANGVLISSPSACSTMKYKNRLDQKIVAGDNDDEFNFGRTSTTKVAIKAIVRNHANGLRYLTIDSGEASLSTIANATRIGYIEVVSITFHP